MSKNLTKAKVLIQKLNSGSISESEFVTLQSLLESDKQIRQMYLEESQFDSSMHFYSESHSVIEDEAIFPETGLLENNRYFSSNNLFRWAPFALALVTVLFGVYFFDFKPAVQHAALAPLQVVSYTGTDNQWHLGDDLFGPVVVSSGVLTVQTLGESLISLEGPCQFQMIGERTGLLGKGKLVAYCGENTDKLTIKTSTGTYADLGTEFGVSVENERSSLHVFDGQVFASSVDGMKSQVIEGASAIQSNPSGNVEAKGLVDFATFGRLRSSLSTGVVSESFDDKRIVIGRNTSFNQWNLYGHAMLKDMSGRYDDTRPLADGLSGSLLVHGKTKSSIEKKVPGFLEAGWNYSSSGPIDISKAHTIECLIRFNSVPEDIHDFTIYGSDEPTWKDRSWMVNATKINGRLMWSVFNSSETTGPDKHQYLAIEKDTTFHVLVEIDPQLGKYRTTVSDGKQRIWNELYDGSPVSLRPAPLGKLFWRIRGKENKELSFSLDSIQVRNRPVLDDNRSLSAAN